MRERDIELKLRDAVKAVGGLCWKFTSPGTSGVPDRIVLMPKGRRKIQLKRHKQLRALGFQVYVLDDKKDIAELVHKIGSDDP